ncbi:hypothetical protein BCV53_11820 [Parageobacillus thermoglucosidasius]|uniref:Uncharacterized protein n=1 Tax=Parageobacillus thermoglucosidasius TaxID=1426 RepID=A0AAN0YP15_PARTM|nr:hypothetical protein AOT13_11810 [Parageobacillus thermoglucosidasius]ANZ30722.1 hypothetical protein BCV53_11820 [Parageobacillus thermoglucosidasius]APM81460.1 hypothetical protein BCV54_11830 [Parageobacillus thermoglucosidasius]KJX69294.1 hypothetical protein WH82_07385 [Parageobacillus thermoglucosidasius]MBY6269020.1 hypothetical protein [Parageobacillus thermoglucosidasius]
MNIFAALPDERADQAQPYPEAPFPQMLRLGNRRSNIQDRADFTSYFMFYTIIMIQEKSPCFHVFCLSDSSPSPSLMKKKRIFSLLINKQSCFLIAYVRKMKRFSMQCLISDRHKSTPAFHLTESGGIVMPVRFLQL